MQANIHSFLESDDRVAVVMKYMDDALAELDTLDGLISTYKIHLDVRLSFGLQHVCLKTCRLLAKISHLFNLKTEVCKCRRKTKELFLLSYRIFW